jgi:integrase/recombinase XerD
VANRSVSVWKSVKVGDRWKYCRPVIGKNKKIRPDWVHVNGHEEHHPEGHYYTHRREGKKQIWTKVGADPAVALRAADFEGAKLKAIAVGVPVKNEAIPLMVSYTLHGYLEEYRLSQRPESYALMKQTLEEFVNLTGKNLIDRITRLDLLKYKQWLIERGRSARTAGNKMLRVNQYLRAVQGLEPGKGLVTVKDAKYVELEPEVYSHAELDAFFAACNPFQTAVFKTLLMSGLRKQELENLMWDDVNYAAGTITVSPKPDFTPKDWEQRTIEVPSDLLAILKTLPLKSQYVFATRSGKQYRHMWDDCVAIAKVAGVKGGHPHKFRSTYATRLLQSGVDLKTVQKLLGHKNLESTMRYLAKAQSQEVRAKMDAVWNGNH